MRFPYPIRNTKPALPSKLAEILASEKENQSNTETTKATSFESEETGRENNLHDGEIFGDSDDESDIEDTLEQSDTESEDDEY